MDVCSQPAEAGKKKGSKNPMRWSSNVKEHFCFQDAVIRSAHRSPQEHWSWQQEHNPNSTLLYKKKNLTRSPTEINKLL